MIILHLLLIFIGLSSYFGHGYQIKDVLPSLVKIEAKGKVLDCAGTILRPNIVLTSAYCVYGIRSENVVVTHIGNTVNTYRTALISVHPEYRENTLRNDVAFIKIEGTFAEPWAAVKLNDVFSENNCSHFQIVGWSGRIANKYNDTDSKAGSIPKEMEKPMIAAVKIIPKSECVDLIGNFGGTFQGSEKLCGVTNDDGECFTGPGGPLLCSPAFKSSVQESDVVKNSKSLKPIDVSKNGTLADPIDLLANFKQTHKSQAKRETETKGDSNNEQILQVGVVSWGKSCSKIPSVYVRTDLYGDWVRNRLKFIDSENNLRNFSNLRKYLILDPLHSAGSPLQSFSTFKTVFGQILLLLQFSFYFCRI